MRWFIVVLIFAGSLFGQPNGPFLIASADSPTLLDSPLGIIDSAGILHAFYVEHTLGEFHVIKAKLNARNGDVIESPSTIYSDTTETLRLEDLALNQFGEPYLLIEQSSGTRHRLRLIRPDHEASQVTLLDTLDTMNPDWGGSIFAISGARFINVESEYIHAVFRVTENTLTRIDNWWCALSFEWPCVVLFQEPDSVTTILPYNGNVAVPLESEGVFTGKSLSSDSLYVWLGDYYEQQRYVVDRANGFHDPQTVDCVFGNFAGQTFHTGTRINLRSEYYYNNRTTHVSAAEMLDSTCIHLSDYSCGGVTDRAVSNLNFGFAFNCNNGISVELIRLDSMGQLAASAGSIAWHEEGWSFSRSTTAIGSDGLVATASIEVSSDLQMQRLVFSSCDWLTPLDADEPPTPVPSAITLTTYPNPFNSTVRIDYELPRAGDVCVSVYNTLGEQVATLFDGHTNAGSHTLSWSPNSASGVYFVKLVSGEFVTSRKILYLR